MQNALNRTKIYYFMWIPLPDRFHTLLRFFDMVEENWGRMYQSTSGMNDAGYYFEEYAVWIPYPHHEKSFIQSLKTKFFFIPFRTQLLSNSEFWWLLQARMDDTEVNALAWMYTEYHGVVNDALLHGIGQGPPLRKFYEFSDKIITLFEDKGVMTLADLFDEIENIEKHGSWENFAGYFGVSKRELFDIFRILDKRKFLNFGDPENNDT